MEYKLTEIVIPKYKRVFWAKNYIKTITATTLVSSGIGLIITGELTRMQNRGWSDAEIILGITAVLLALIIVFILDTWAAKKDKQMIQDIDDYIDKRAEEIAEELVMKHLNEIGKEVENGK